MLGVWLGKILLLCLHNFALHISCIYRAIITLNIRTPNTLNDNLQSGPSCLKANDVVS